MSLRTTAAARARPAPSGTGASAPRRSGTTAGARPTAGDDR